MNMLGNILSYQHFPIYAIMALFLGSFLIAAFGEKRSVRNILALLSVTAALGFILALMKPVVFHGEIISYWMGAREPAGGYAIGIALEVDALSFFFALLVAVAVFVSGVYSIQYMNRDDNEKEYYTLYLLLCGGVMGMVLSGDLFNMFIMVEILTFAAVALTAFRNTVRGAVEAAFKYLVVGCMGSTCILVGTAILYAQTHTLNLAQLAQLAPGDVNTATRLAFALLFVGFGTKAFIVPFHPLAADAHGAAPASVSVIISGVLTKSGIYGIIRICYFLFQSMGLGAMQFLLVFIGSLSMFVCVTMALAQHDFKRLLAFHSISQIGYVLTAVGLCTALGVSAGLYHAINHTLFKGLLFLAAGAVLHETGTTDLNKLGGLAKKMPHTTALFMVGAFSISGVPPFNGFASKWMIYQASYQKAVESGNIGFLLVTIIALITSVLTLASFVKVSHSVFFGQLPPELANVKEVSWGMRSAMGIFALLCIITGLFPNLVTAYFTEPAAAAVFNVKNYIEAMGFDGSAAVQLEAGGFQHAGVWNPVSWLLVLCIALLAITIVAVAGKYDNVSRCRAPAVENKYQLFYGGEEQEFSQLGGEDLFWGFKHNWRGYFKFMHRLHSGVVNDYALWAVVDLALVTLFSLIVL